MKIVYLKPRTSFRNNLRSDTLWGLICWGIKTIYSEEKLENFISKYETEEFFKISSPFFFTENENGAKEEFFPRPILKPLNLNKFFEKNKITSKAEKADYIAKIKKYKKNTAVSLTSFKKFLSGEFNEESYFLSNYWDNNLQTIKRVDILHNSIDRIKNTTVENSLFTTSEIFVKNGGLFFLIEGSEEQINIVEGALRYFNHVGLGGDASIGKNSFEITVEEFAFPQVNNADAFVTLSLYSPTQNEIKKFTNNPDLAWYELEARKGKFGGQFIKQKHFWKDSVLMFKEGSVFPELGKKNYGKNKIVLKKEENGHFDVYHYGYAFNLPIKVK